MYEHSVLIKLEYGIYSQERGWYIVDSKLAADDWCYFILIDAKFDLVLLMSLTQIIKCFDPYNKWDQCKYKGSV